MTAQKTLEPKYNREYKDSLFRTLFIEKDELISLYNVVARFILDKSIFCYLIIMIANIGNAHKNDETEFFQLVAT